MKGREKEREWIATFLRMKPVYQENFRTLAALLRLRSFVICRLANLQNFAVTNRVLSGLALIESFT